MAVTQKEQDYLNSIKNSDAGTIQEGITEKLTRDEREINLVYNEGEGVWYADTSIPKYWRRLEKKNWECIGVQYYKDGTICSKSFKGSKKGVSITDPFRTREMSEEQKQKIRERFSKKQEFEDNDDEVE
jgi:hypothetical protein